MRFVLVAQEAGLPFLDAKALKTDPNGMTFLRAVLGPTKPSGPVQPQNPRREDASLEDKVRRAKTAQLQQTIRRARGTRRSTSGKSAGRTGIC